MAAWSSKSDGALHSIQESLPLVLKYSTASTYRWIRFSSCGQSFAVSWLISHSQAKNCGVPGVLTSSGFEIVLKKILIKAALPSSDKLQVSVGRAVGLKLGEEEGSGVGDLEGMPVGTGVGIRVGKAVGVGVGKGEGSEVGTKVGSLVGSIVGSFDLKIDGGAEAFAVGDVEVSLVGTGDAGRVGELVGDSDSPFAKDGIEEGGEEAMDGAKD